MLSLLESLERVRRNEAVPESDLRTCQNSPNAVERFLAHSALAMISMQAARDHQLDALRAIDYADRQVLQGLLELSRILEQPAGVAQAIVRHAVALVERKQWAAALEAISQAVRFDQAHLGELANDSDAWADICSAFENASRTLGRSVHAPRPAAGPLRVGFLTTSLVDHSPTQRLLDGWLRYANPDIATLRLYVTDHAARLPRHSLQLCAPADPSSRSGAKCLADLKSRGIDPWIAPPDADAIQCSRMLTERLVRDQVELLIVDASLDDAAIGMTVAGRPVACQVAIQRGRPVPLSGLDEVLDVHAHLAFDQDPLLISRGIRSRAIFQGIDLGDAAPVSRRDYGIADDAVVFMTCCEAPETSLSPAFLRMVARLLAEHPRAVYLLAAEGDLSRARAVFESTGVIRRVGFAGKLRDLPAFLAMTDLYLAEFPDSSREGVLTAMTCGKPVLILAGEHDRPGHAPFVGAPHAVVGSPATLLDRCAAMLRDAQLRESVGATLKRRALERFSLRSTIDGLMSLAGAVADRRPADPADAGLTMKRVA